MAIKRTIEEPDVLGPEAPLPAKAKFDFAANPIKLRRAHAFVNAQQPAVAAADLEEAVKSRYIQIGGLLVEDRPVRSGPHRKGLSHDVE